MLAYSHYRTNPEVICINQDVPTYFYAVQRSRLPMVAMPLDRGLSDTSTGEVNQDYSTKLSNILFVSSMFSSLAYVLRTGYANGIGRKTVVNSRAIHLITRPDGLSERLLAAQAKIAKPAAIASMVYLRITYQSVTTHPVHLVLVLG